MLVTILHRIAGTPTPANQVRFHDVIEGQWYTQAVSWAQERGIVSGKAGNRFAPKGDTTRAEVAVMLHRFLTADETEVPPNDTEDSRVLFAYFSRSGTTQAVAEQIGQELGADVFRITATHSYPTDYRETTAQAQEELDRDFRPVLTDTVENMAQCDTIRQWLDRVGVEERTAEAPQATQITMTVGTTVITAELSDSPTTRDFLATLPNTVTLSRYGDREYYGNPGAALSADGTPIPDYENGDVTFYPPSGSLAIFFGQQDSSNQSGLIRMGKMASDLSVFDAFGQSIEMTIAIVSQ